MTSWLCPSRRVVFSLQSEEAEQGKSAPVFTRKVKPKQRGLRGRKLCKRSELPRLGLGALPRARRASWGLRPTDTGPTANRTNRARRVFLLQFRPSVLVQAQDRVKAAGDGEKSIVMNRPRELQDNQAQVRVPFYDDFTLH